MNHVRLCSGRKIKLTRAVFVAVVSMLVLSACRSGPPPRLYLLQEPSISIDAADNASQNAVQALGIKHVKLPGYAVDARIATRQADDVVTRLDDQRWAEEPAEAITRLLGNQLRERAGATVLVEPWPRDYNPQARVEVLIDTLLREPDGGAHISGQIYLVSGDGRKLLEALSFDTRVRGRSTETTEFFRAAAVIVDELARLSIEALLALNTQS